MLVIGLDRFEEIKDPSSKLNIDVCERRISLLINKRTGRKYSRTEQCNRTERSTYKKRK